MHFSVWDTRVQDFETFAKSTGYDAAAGVYSIGKVGWTLRGATWKEPGFSQGPTYPVVGVSWNDANEFCRWLTKHERSAANLPEDKEYRLPTDEEWSTAVGLKNEAGSTPLERGGNVKLYPWDIPLKRDKSWPPPTSDGMIKVRPVNQLGPQSWTCLSFAFSMTHFYREFWTNRSYSKAVSFLARAREINRETLERSVPKM